MYDGSVNTIHRPVPDFPDIYAGMDGTIVNGKTGHTLKPTPNVKSGYPCVTIFNSDGVRKNRPVHVLMMAAFCGPRPDGLETLHANGDVSDASLINLSYGTRAQNILDQVRHGTHPFLGRGKANPQVVTKIRRRHALGEEQQALAAEFGLCKATVHSIVHRKTWRQVP